MFERVLNTPVVSSLGYYLKYYCVIFSKRSNDYRFVRSELSKHVWHCPFRPKLVLTYIRPIFLFYTPSIKRNLKFSVFEGQRKITLVLNRLDYFYSNKNWFLDLSEVVIRFCIIPPYQNHICTRLTKSHSTQQTVV